MVLQANHAFLVLISKKKGASSLSEYRPIACCSVFYKIIFKILAERLKIVLPDIISKFQGAFVKGRSIANCTLLASEFLVDFNIQRGAPKACLKLDISKAYDSVSWKAIHWCLTQMDFDKKVNRMGNGVYYHHLLLDSGQWLFYWHV